MCHSNSYIPFTTMGSGSLAAMAIFEQKFRDNLPVFSFLKFLKF